MAAPRRSFQLFLASLLAWAFFGGGERLAKTADASDDSATSNVAKKEGASGEASGDDETGAQRAAFIANVDRLVAARWREANLAPTTVSDDAEFLRRVSLDLTGIVPRVSETREFLADTRPDKRQRMIDRLLKSPRYATHRANQWRDILLPGGLEAEQQQAVAGVQNWLREQFAEGTRYDRIASDFLVVTDGGEAGPALFYTALELKPEKLASATARIFLGLQIECAQCHHHPFDKWRQEEFWGYAAFFAQLRQPRDMAIRTTRLEDLDVGEVKLPGTEQVVAPRFPDGSPQRDSTGTRREQLAIWLASRDNPYLARAAVNRVWSQLFGRGLVEPVDDLGPHNPPSHPELLDELTRYFTATGFDLRELYRALTNTATYQLSSRWTSETIPPAELFARSEPRPMSGDQFYDSLLRIAGPGSTSGMPVGAPALQDPRRQAFLARWPSSARTASEYQAGVLQALTLMNGTETSAATQPENSSLLTMLDSPLFTPEQRVETLFLGAATRPPTREESTACVAHLQQADDARRALGDILWALVNSAEFAFIH